MNRQDNKTQDAPSRRAFLRRAAAASTTWAVPWIIPSSAWGSNAPSNRINLACIGTGNQGINILRKFMANEDVQIVSVCDVNEASFGYKSDDQFLGRKPVQEEVHRFYAHSKGVESYKDCSADHDFREVLGRADVDAVTIVVPDHWHGIMTVRAAEAGKDIYCEKPLSLTIHQGQQMVRAVRRHQRILQTGSMERSNPLTDYVCQLARTGASEKCGEW